MDIRLNKYCKDCQDYTPHTNGICDDCRSCPSIPKDNIFHVRYHVDFPGDPSAGLRSYNNEVAIFTIDDPGGEKGEFEEYMRGALQEWFDGAKVLSCQSLFSSEAK